MADDAPKRRSLIPREHGAWVQLLLPSLCAIGLGEPTVAAFALLTCATALFVAHESVLVLLGHRGATARSREAARARAWLTALLALALVGAALTLHGASIYTLRALLYPLLFVGLATPFVIARKERTTAGEAIIALALGAVAFPVARVAGVDGLRALTATLVWQAIFLVGTLAARGILARGKKRAPSETLARAALALALVLQTGLLLGAGPTLALAFLPATVVAAMAALLPLGPRDLMRVGVTMLVGGLLTTTVLWMGSF